VADELAHSWIANQRGMVMREGKPVQ